jgi:hypothetical protein
MNVRYSKIEAKINELSKWVESKKRKMNIIDWLNENYKNPLEYDTWIKSIQVKRNQLEYIFKYEYIEGVFHILKDLLPDHAVDKHAIKAFIQKDNALFAYIGEKWTIVLEEHFNLLLDHIFKQLMGQFINWQKENLYRLEEDEFSDEYAMNVKKIMGGNHTREQICLKVKKELYNYLKINLVQYEFI